MGLEHGPGSARPGRPPSTTRADIAATALHLFSERGFENTTVDDIAAAVGIGRRTLFRYFRSKSDIAWGDFEGEIARLRRHLAALDKETPVMVAIRRAVVATNDFREGDIPELRERIQLLTQAPTLQAHSALRYADWRTAVAAFTAARTGSHQTDLLPQAIGHATLGVTLSAFLSWVHQPPGDLAPHLERAMIALENGFSDSHLMRGSQAHPHNELLGRDAL